jgi:predicted MFS family arabinose efflux permease
MSQRAKNLIIICLAMLLASVMAVALSPNWAILLVTGYAIGFFAGASIESERAK